MTDMETLEMGLGVLADSSDPTGTGEAPSVSGVGKTGSPRRRWGTIARMVTRFARDRRGGTGVQAMVMLPAILLVFMSGIKIWEVISIRKSLNTGVHLATRYLSLYPPSNVSEMEWGAIAETFIYAELRNNAFVDKVHLNRRSVPVSVALLDAGNQCTDKFEVRANYPLNVEMRLGTWAMPNLQWAQIQNIKKGEVICD